MCYHVFMNMKGTGMTCSIERQMLAMMEDLRNRPWLKTQNPNWYALANDWIELNNERTFRSKFIYRPTPQRGALNRPMQSASIRNMLIDVLT